MSTGVTGSRAPSSTTPSWGRRLVGIEGLRGIAAVSVILGHARIHTAPDVDLGPPARILGALDGLTLFFALSGFLLFRPFAAAIISDAPRPPAGRFFRNRALRIYPAYVVILLLASFALQTTYVVASDAESGFGGVRSTLGPITDPWKLLLDLSMFHTLVPGTLKTGLGVAWSLTAELCFYLVLPLLAAAAAWLARRVNKLIAVWLVPVALLITGVVGKLVATVTMTGTSAAERYPQEWGPTWHAVFERSLFVHADLFGWGAVAAVVFVMIERQLLSARTVFAVRVGAIAGFLVVGLLLVGPGLPGPLGALRWKDSPTAAACAALILWATLPTRHGRASWLGRALESRLLHFSGLVSYSAYLWHLPVLWWLVVRGWTFGPTPIGYLGNFVLILAITLILSTATYYLVEAPALKMKKRTDGGKSTDAGLRAGGDLVPSPAGPSAAVPKV